MARTPEPPGPPPAHYRPPGTSPSPSTKLLGQPLGQNPSPPPPTPSSDIRFGAVVALAVAALLIGLVGGFFLGRATDSSADETGQQFGPPVVDSTTSTSRPPGDTIPQEPPPSSVPPATELEPTIIGTPDQPIPVGQGYVVGDIEITVDGVDYDANETIREYAPSNPPPPDGQQNLLVSITIEFLGPGEPINTGYLPFALATRTREWSDLDATCGAVPDSLYDGKTIAEGDAATGNTCFTVPIPATEQELFITTEGFDGPIYFALPGR